MSEQTASAAAPAAPSIATADLVLPMVTSVICSLVLESISDLSGTAKIGLAAALGAGLWWFTTGRQAAAARSARVRARTAEPAGAGGGAAAAGGPGFVRANRGWLLLIVVLLAVIALLVTRLMFGRPTVATAIIALAVLAVTTVLALRGRRGPWALTAAVSGGLLGLCLGIAFL